MRRGGWESDDRSAAPVQKAAETRVWERLGFSTFRAFLEAPDPDGLGMTVGDLKHAVALAGPKAEHTVATLLRGEIEQTGPHGTNQFGHSTTVSRPSRDTADFTVAKLKRDDPALAARVLNGELSAYAAARAKGWKPPRIQVTTPERTAAHLRKHMTTEQLSALARLLQED